MSIDHTHQPQARSWVASANGHPDFPIQNLPLCRYAGVSGATRVGAGIGDSVLDLTALSREGGLPAAAKAALAPVASGQLDALMAAGDEASQALRLALRSEERRVGKECRL